MTQRRDPPPQIPLSKGKVFKITLDLPFIEAGYSATHLISFRSPMMLAIHILSVELLMVLLPFTKLFHAGSTFVSRWYNGEILGHKGAAL